jgi:hypothetical protein
MGDELLQFIIVVAFGALCFGCGSIIAFIMTRNKYRNEMIKRGVARYNQQTANGNGESRQRNRRRGKCNNPNRGGLRRISLSCRSWCGALSCSVAHHLSLLPDRSISANQR